MSECEWFDGKGGGSWTTRKKNPTRRKFFIISVSTLSFVLKPLSAAITSSTNDSNKISKSRFYVDVLLLLRSWWLC